MHKEDTAKSAAIVLAAGTGKRMQSDVAKQFLEVDGKPVIYYALKAFEDSKVTDVILVTGEDDIDYCSKQIVQKYGFSKVRAVVAGGAERYHSVARGLESLAGVTDPADGKDWQDPEFVMIHDGARLFVTPALINDLLEKTKVHQACVTGTPVKDTIKVVDDQGFSVSTPNRSSLWAVQTPQSFSYPLILSAYRRLIAQEEELLAKGIVVTDDAMVAELMTDTKVQIVRGSYLNTKLTTPEDLLLAERMLEIVSSTVD
ncbi:MAG: 2-C-methyl-D-erythritol 4-phosphate cytidylyltransferase [Lachnospiraceae bacterium]|nr:2-C-methyl-D-erythritol 4-phosphate cytidylyltransferase [Lachnospiraceae bacterium]